MLVNSIEAKYNKNAKKSLIVRALGPDGRLVSFIILHVVYSTDTVSHITFIYYHLFSVKSSIYRI